MFLFLTICIILLKYLVLFLTEKEAYGMDNVSIVLFICSIAGALISCGFSVVSWHYSKKNASAELHGHVDDLIFTVEKMAKAQRKEKMTNVRAAAQDSSSTQSALELNKTAGLPVRRSKEELRQMLQQKRVN